MSALGLTMDKSIMSISVSERSSTRIWLFLAWITSATITNGEYPACNSITTGDTVYFGAGQFYFPQFMFYRIERGSSFLRPYHGISSLAGYAGGFATGPAPNNQVCDPAGPTGTNYAMLGHTQAIQVTLDINPERAALEFSIMTQRYFAQMFVPINGTWSRRDPQDRGAMFRDIIGAPGGLSGPLGRIIRENNIHGFQLVHGGNRNIGWDYHGEGVVYVYDTAQYPFFRAEREHQFHVTPQLNLSHRMTEEYSWAARNQSSLNRLNSTCGEQAADSKSNMELPCCPKSMYHYNATDYGDTIYFGAGAIWRTQYTLYQAERSSPFSRSPNETSARAGYGGGVGSGQLGQICYGGDLTNHSVFGYAEAAQVVLDKNKIRAVQEVLQLAIAYFQNEFKVNTTTRSVQRMDPLDRGQNYRNIIGVPGGYSGVYTSWIRQANSRVHNMTLVEGGRAYNGHLHDNHDEGFVYIYDTDTHPFFRAERHRQFLPDPSGATLMSSEYLNVARASAIQKSLIDLTCGEDESAQQSSNIEIFSCPIIPLEIQPSSSSVFQPTSTIASSTTIASTKTTIRPFYVEFENSDGGLIIGGLIGAILFSIIVVLIMRWRLKKRRIRLYTVVHVNKAYDKGINYDSDSEFSDIEDAEFQ